MNYFDILARTWKTIWNHKVILAFGLLAMLVPGLLGFLMGGRMLFFSFDIFNLVCIGMVGFLECVYAAFVFCDRSRLDRRFQRYL
jgi:hypothetical protein